MERSGFLRVGFRGMGEISEIGRDFEAKIFAVHDGEFSGGGGFEGFFEGVEFFQGIDIREFGKRSGIGGSGLFYIGTGFGGHGWFCGLSGL